MSRNRVSRIGRDEVSHLSSLVRFIRHAGARRVRGGSAVEDRPRIAVEGLRVTPTRLARYLGSTFGEGLGSSLLPPTLPAIWETALALDLLRLAGFGFPGRGVLHVGSERVLVRHPLATELLDLHLALGDRRRTRGGTRVRLDAELRNRRGQTCQISRTELLIRGLDPLEEEPRGSEGSQPRDFEEVVRLGIPASAGRRYARASGDINPIHLSRLSARPFGFQGAILQGACIEGIVANRLALSRLGGDPSRLRRLEVRFVAPLVLPAEVALEVATDHPPSSPRKRGPREDAPDLGTNPGTGAHVFRLTARTGRPLGSGEADSRVVAVGSYVAE